jgi:hypothetical protein
MRRLAASRVKTLVCIRCNLGSNLVMQKELKCPQPIILFAVVPMGTDALRCSYDQRMKYHLKVSSVDELITFSGVIAYPTTDRGRICTGKGKASEAKIIAAAKRFAQYFSEMFFIDDASS